MSGGSQKFAKDPPRPLTVSSRDVVPWSAPLVRVASTIGRHPLPWGALRHYGPVAGQRWDPHPPGPPQDHAPWGVLYCGDSLATACAEVGQATRTIDRVTGAPVVMEWSPARPLELLDLRSSATWLIRHGGASALVHGVTSVTRRWAHGIATDLGGVIDGLLVPSTMTGTNIVLFGRASDTFPTAPRTSIPLTAPQLFPVLDRIAAQLGYELV